MTANELSNYCSQCKSEGRKSITAPWIVWDASPTKGGILYATDGRIMLRMPVNGDKPVPRRYGATRPRQKSISSHFTGEPIEFNRPPEAGKPPSDDLEAVCSFDHQLPRFKFPETLPPLNYNDPCDCLEQGSPSDCSDCGGLGKVVSHDPVKLIIPGNPETPRMCSNVYLHKLAALKPHYLRIDPHEENSWKRDNQNPCAKIWVEWAMGEAICMGLKLFEPACMPQRVENKSIATIKLEEIQWPRS